MKENIKYIALTLLLLVFLFIFFYPFSSKKKESYRETKDPLIHVLKHDLSKVHPIASRLDFHSLDRCDLGDSATEDKKRIYICLKDKKGKYYNYNKLKQVGIHELAHALTKVVDPDHVSVEFLETYDDLLSRASQIGVIDMSKLKSF